MVCPLRFAGLEGRTRARPRARWVLKGLCRKKSSKRWCYVCKLSGQCTLESPSAFWCYALPDLVVRRRSSRIWNILPFKNLIISKELPDGNRLLYSWKDHFAVARVVYEIYFQQVYRQYEIGKSSFVLDVGAHIGIYSLQIAKKWRDSTIVAIEPEI